MIPGDVNYNDFWQVYKVTVPADYVANTITSYQEILDGHYTITKTNDLVNCPVVPKGSTASKRFTAESSGLTQGWYKDKVVYYFNFSEKPLSVREFIARVKVIFRRKEEGAHKTNLSNQPKLKFDNLEIDVDKRKIILDNARIELSPKEFELLTLLASNPGKSYTRKKLLSLVWGYDFDGYEHTVNSHINRLRGKIENDISNPKYILTTWGIGYRFNEEL